MINQSVKQVQLLFALEDITTKNNGNEKRVTDVSQQSVTPFRKEY